MIVPTLKVKSGSTFGIYLYLRSKCFCLDFIKEMYFSTMFNLEMVFNEVLTLYYFKLHEVVPPSGLIQIVKVLPGAVFYLSRGSSKFWSYVSSQRLLVFREGAYSRDLVPHLLPSARRSFISHIIEVSPCSDLSIVLEAGS